MTRLTTLSFAALSLLVACDQETEAQNPTGESAGTCTGGITEAAMDTARDDIGRLAIQMETLKTRMRGLEQEAEKLRGQIDMLRSTDDSMRNDIEVTEDYLGQHRAAIARAAALVPYVRVEGANLIVEGANIHIRSGAGRTDAAPNGLGNLVIGYGEWAAYCVGGYDDGDVCVQGTGESQCRGGFCVRRDDPVTTGSHNLILGPRHQYSSHSCLLVGDGGQRDVAADPYCAMLP